MFSPGGQARNQVGSQPHEGPELSPRPFASAQVSCQVGSSWQRLARLSNVITINLTAPTIILMMTPPRSDPVADLAESVGKALLEFAERLRANPDSTAPGPGDTPTAEAQSREPDTSKLGATQARIVAVLEAAGEEGMTSGQVADAVGIETSNAPRTLRKLEERNLIVGSGERPVVWRVRAEDADG